MKDRKGGQKEGEEVGPSPKRGGGEVVQTGFPRRHARKIRRKGGGEFVDHLLRKWGKTYHG